MKRIVSAIVSVFLIIAMMPFAFAKSTSIDDWYRQLGWWHAKVIVNNTEFTLSHEYSVDLKRNDTKKHNFTLSTSALYNEDKTQAESEEEVLNSLSTNALVLAYSKNKPVVKWVNENGEEWTAESLKNAILYYNDNYAMGDVLDEQAENIVLIAVTDDDYHASRSLDNLNNAANNWPKDAYNVFSVR